MRIYISGAITGTEDFRERFLEAEKELIAAGHDTVNPARLNDIMPKDATHEEYMRMSFELLDICDAIYMLDGWESSKGANQEYGFAKGKGIEIYGCIERWRNEIR
nr:MAG TPA: Blasticidin M [Bacteriophage sp.]